jgi:septum formation protein
MAAAPIWLASGSPRRRQMLADAGLDVRVHPPDIDDGALRPGKVFPAQWVMALAYLKARRVGDQLRGRTDRFAMWFGNGMKSDQRGLVLGADTVCVAHGEILGQARSAADARRMLHLLRNDTHVTITGVCLIDLASGSRTMFVDQTRVHIGRINDRQIEDYLASGEWKGKAGAYNLSERQAAGWSIEVEGDPGTVMGLPMRRLLRLLN